MSNTDMVEMKIFSGNIPPYHSMTL